MQPTGTPQARVEAGTGRTVVTMPTTAPTSAYVPRTNAPTLDQKNQAIADAIFRERQGDSRTSLPVLRSSALATEAAVERQQEAVAAHQSRVPTPQPGAYVPTRAAVGRHPNAQEQQAMNAAASAPAATIYVVPLQTGSTAYKNSASVSIILSSDARMDRAATDGAAMERAPIGARVRKNP
jgi:hypothetical protein